MKPLLNLLLSMQSSPNGIGRTLIPELAPSFTFLKDDVLQELFPPYNTIPLSDLRLLEVPNAITGIVWYHISDNSGSFLGYAIKPIIKTNSVTNPH